MLTGPGRFNQLSALPLQTSGPQSPAVMAAIIAKITREARERKVGSDIICNIGKEIKIKIS